MNKGDSWAQDVYEEHSGEEDSCDSMADLYPEGNNIGQNRHCN